MDVSQRDFPPFVDTAVRGSFTRVMLWLWASTVTLFLSCSALHERQRYQAEALAAELISSVAAGREYRELIAPGLELAIESARPLMTSGFRVIGCDDAGSFGARFDCFAELHSGAVAAIDVREENDRKVIRALRVKTPRFN